MGSPCLIRYCFNDQKEISPLFAEYAVMCLLNNASFFNMQMDELACFAPGMLALASYNGPREAEKYLTCRRGSNQCFKTRSIIK